MLDPSDPGSGDLADELRALDQQAQARRHLAALALRVGALIIAASFVYFLRADLRYAAESRVPVELGGPLEFQLEREASQKYAAISGLPGELAPTADHGGLHLRMFGLLTTNVVVVQNLAEVGPDAKPARNQPYSAKGRLVRDDDAGELRFVFTLLEQRGLVSRIDDHLYALFDGEVPRQGWSLPLELLGILAFVLVNMRAAHRLQHRVDSPPTDPS